MWTQSNYDYIVFYSLADSHHKLIRWRLVTHGAIDGYSRLVLYVHCATNIKAATVLEQFLSAVNGHGLPSRVRSDQGLENTLVARYMIERRGANRRSMLVGCSTHNQRIERLWRDMHKGVTILFYKLFYFMEDQGILDPLNEYHLWTLHYIFVPRIRKALDKFTSAWNNHPIRTAHHHSPQQLFTSGALLLQHSNSEAFDFLEHVNDDYGYDEDAPIPSEDSEEGVHVPKSAIQFSDSDLKETVNPTAPSNDYGMDLYKQTLVYISNLTVV